MKKGKGTPAVVEKTDNPYYGCDDIEGSGDIAVQTRNNPYYGGEVELGSEPKTIKKTDDEYYMIQ